MLSTSREFKVRKQDYLMPVLISYLPLFALLKKKILVLAYSSPRAAV